MFVSLYASLYISINNFMPSGCILLLHPVQTKCDAARQENSKWCLRIKYSWIPLYELSVLWGAFLVITLQISTSYNSTMSVFSSQKYPVFQKDLLHFHLNFSLDNSVSQGMFPSYESLLKMLHLVMCERLNVG